jgi:hypothetical protein
VTRKRRNWIRLSPQRAFDVASNSSVIRVARAEAFRKWCCWTVTRDAVDARRLAEISAPAVRALLAGCRFETEIAFARSVRIARSAVARRVCDELLALAEIATGRRRRDVAAKALGALSGSGGAPVTEPVAGARAVGDGVGVAEARAVGGGVIHEAGASSVNGRAESVT